MQLQNFVTLSSVSLRCPGPPGGWDSLSSTKSHFPCNLIPIMKLFNMHRLLCTRAGTGCIFWLSSNKMFLASQGCTGATGGKLVAVRVGDAEMISWVRKSRRSFRNVLRNAMSWGLRVQSRCCCLSSLLLSLFFPVGCWWCHSQDAVPCKTPWVVLKISPCLLCNPMETVGKNSLYLKILHFS